VNFGVVPLTFAAEADYDAIEPGDMLEIRDLGSRVRDGASTLDIVNISKGTTVITHLDLLPRLRSVLLAGGLLNFVGQAAKEAKA
jgi:aconitate hydratase